uniref:G2/M phase-specific E3 ubiquitin-protein ligase-like n=1 Tax=Semicossyphus pulcher TaxID=241346 RepID=UPI0037E9816A
MVMDMAETDENSSDTPQRQVVCPICTKEFPEDEITFHASRCGESFDSAQSSAANDYSPSLPAQTPVFEPKHVEDVLCFLQHQVDTTTEFKLCVHRDDLPDRGILQWKRKKSATPVSALKVVYIGEAGIDTGALRKEFLTDMISGIENRFFEGTGSHGKNPMYSLTDLDNDNFRVVGEIMAVSLAQGGPPPAFLKEWCYNFLCTGEVDFNSLSLEDVSDLESCLLISKVQDAADSQSLMLCADEIVSCGYTSQIKMDSKDGIIRAIVLHSTTRLIPMLQQLQKGMKLYGLVDQMGGNPEACRSLFVPGEIIKRMMIPSSSEGGKVCLQSREKDVVHTKEVNHIRDVKQAIFFQ